MYKCHFYSFGYTKHFNTYEEALDCGRKSGFSGWVVEGPIDVR